MRGGFRPDGGYDLIESFADYSAPQEFSAEYVEEEHPRDEKGLWVEKGGEGASGKDDDLWKRDEPKWSLDNYHERQMWEQSVFAAASLGKLTLEDAEARGIHILTMRGDPWGDLPPDLYHVTTNVEAVERDGLKSRFELGMDTGTGLGGGEDKSISFTTDAETALAIADAFQEAHDVATGAKTIADMMEEARGAGGGAERPYLEGIMRQWKSDWKTGDPLPDGVKAGLVGVFLRHTLPSIEPPRDEPGDWKPSRFDKGWLRGDGKVAHTEWERPETEDEARENRFSFYKTFAFFREHAGGRMDPLFFSSDVKALARMDPKRDVAVLHLRPIRGARGTRMGSSLSEWRTYTGKAVKLVGRVKR